MRRLDDWLMHVSRRAMATEFEVLLPWGAPESFIEVAMEGLNEVERLEQLLSVYRPMSAVSRLNARAGAIDSVNVGPELIEVLECAKQISELTGGAFDISAGPLVAAWGFMQRSGRKPTKQEIEQARNLVNWREVQWQASRGTARLPRAGMQINLGGIGKGYAIDRAARALLRGEVPHFLIHGGQSSAIAFGQQSSERRGWAVSLHHPTRTGIRLGALTLENRALATSGSGRQFFHFQGERLGHVIDPRNGWPAKDLLSLTVLAPTAMEADALATGLFVLGRKEAWELMQSRPEVGLIAVSAAERDAEVVIETLHVEGIWESHDYRDQTTQLQ